eukprot:SAG11_NODE_1959_length_3999_cov_1.662308_2_plen_314_part_00
MISTGGTLVTTQMSFLQSVSGKVRFPLMMNLPVKSQDRVAVIQLSSVFLCLLGFDMAKYPEPAEHLPTEPEVSATKKSPRARKMERIVERRPVDTTAAAIDGWQHAQPCVASETASPSSQRRRYYARDRSGRWKLKGPQLQEREHNVARCRPMAMGRPQFQDDRSRSSANIEANRSPRVAPSLILRQKREAARETPPQWFAQVRMASSVDDLTAPTIPTAPHAPADVRSAEKCISPPIPAEQQSRREQLPLWKRGTQNPRSPRHRSIGGCVRTHCRASIRGAAAPFPRDAKILGFRPCVALALYPWTLHAVCS